MEIMDSPLSRSAWDAAIGTAPMQQSWAYGAIAARFGARVRRVSMGGGMAQIILRTLGPVRVAHLPAGLHWPAGACSQGDTLRPLRDFLSADGPTLLVSPSSTADGLRLAAPRDMACLDLIPNGDVLMSGLHGKWRNRLRAAARSGMYVTVTPEVPAWLIAAERRQQRARRYGNLPPAWLEAWMRLAPRDVLTFIAHDAEGPAAAMTFITHGRGATYLLGWTSDAGRRLSAHNLTMWHAMVALKERGSARLDLGQIDREANPGLARFKLATGAAITSLPSVRALGPRIGGWSRPSYMQVRTAR